MNSEHPIIVIFKRLGYWQVEECFNFQQAVFYARLLLLNGAEYAHITVK